jgi:Sec-independent protein secretion pathway component TatC
MTLFRIMTPQFLWKNARYAILVIAFVAAIVAPTPDAKTMLIFIVLMIALYFLGILLARSSRAVVAPWEDRNIHCQLRAH